MRVVVVRVDGVVVAKVEEGDVKEEVLDVVVVMEELGLEVVATVDEGEDKDGDVVLELSALEMAW